MKKRIAYQFKEWLLPILLIGVIGLVEVLSNLSSARLVYQSDTVPGVGRNIAASASRSVFFSALIVALILGFVLALLSSDYKFKKDRYDAYGQLPVGVNGIRKLRVIFGLVAVDVVFTLLMAAGAIELLIKSAIANATLQQGFSLVEIDYLSFLVFYAYGVVMLSAVFLFTCALSSMSHSFWSAICLMVVGNAILVVLIDSIVNYCIPYRDANAFYNANSFGVFGLFVVGDLFARKAALEPFNLASARLAYLLMAQFITLGVGVGSGFYLYFRKEPSGEYCGSKRYDTLPKELLPHIMMGAYAFLIAASSYSVQVTTSDQAVATLLARLFSLGSVIGFAGVYIVLLLVYFGTLRLKKIHWILYGAIVGLILILTVIAMVIGMNR